jgi:hypothetical protein
VLFGKVSKFSITFILCTFPDSEEPKKATRGRVNESQSKFLCKNSPMSQVQTPKRKPYKKVMNTPTNSIEMIPSKL